MTMAPPPPPPPMAFAPQSDRQAAIAAAAQIVCVAISSEQLDIKKDDVPKVLENLIASLEK